MNIEEKDDEQCRKLGWPTISEQKAYWEKLEVEHDQLREQLAAEREKVPIGDLTIEQIDQLLAPHEETVRLLLARRRELMKEKL